MTDEEIVNGLRRSEKETIQYATKRFWLKVNAKLRDNVPLLSKRKEIYEEAFLRFWEKCKDPEFVCENADGYVLKIAGNYDVEQYRTHNGTHTRYVDIEGALPNVSHGATDDTTEDGEGGITIHAEKIDDMAPRRYRVSRYEASIGKRRRIVGYFTLNEILEALDQLKEHYRTVIEQYYLEEPPVPLKDIRVLKKGSNDEYRNYEDLKKLKQRALAKLSQLLKIK